MTQSSEDSIARRVRELARANHITATRSRLSNMAVTITRLAGDDVELDTIEQLLVNLKRKGVLTKAETLALQGQYLVEKRSSNKKLRA